MYIKFVLFHSEDAGEFFLLICFLVMANVCWSRERKYVRRV